MGNRRFVPTSDDEDDAPLPPRRNSNGEESKKRKRKKVHLPDEEEEEEMDEAKLSELNKRRRRPKIPSLSLSPLVKMMSRRIWKRSHWAMWLGFRGSGFIDQKRRKKKGGGNWQSRDTRELFYSFHRDEVPAESVMHKCVVHFIPLNKQIPRRKEHPGFIVQKVYDTEQRRLFKLTDKDYEDNKQHEIDLLVQKTLARLGDLPDVDPEDVPVDHEEQTKRLGRSQSLKAETPGSTCGSVSEYYAILSHFKVLTGETQRDKWLEKLLQSIKSVCNPIGSKQNDEDKQGGNKNVGSNHRSESDNKGDASFGWPDAAVPAVAALEKAAHDTLSNVALARRLLNKELEPAQILNMSPNELKLPLITNIGLCFKSKSDACGSSLLKFSVLPQEGLTAEEIASREPEESGHMQMTDARCKRCSERPVGLIDIIQAGHGDRYQLQCVPCGFTWYASRDDAATLTIEGPSAAKMVGTAPLATAKFEDAEKNW
ncbi:hypothetical protein DH2020_005506 [Rehmannia glutinosa]|uniref:BAH domain-containing protein n=1 Tax=Rehmannia glutinosa TaxID=99300 RepID=A0ABR0XGB3_REHGL